MHEKISALLNQFIEWRTRHINNKQFTLILSLAVGFLAAVAASILTRSSSRYSICSRWDSTSTDSTGYISYIR